MQVCMSSLIQLKPINSVTKLFPFQNKQKHQQYFQKSGWCEVSSTDTQLNMLIMFASTANKFSQLLQLYTSSTVLDRKLQNCFDHVLSFSRNTTSPDHVSSVK